MNVDWPAGFAGDTSCDTNISGQCSVISGNIANRNKSVTLTVTGVNDPGYYSMDNHDPDGDSDGTMITVFK